ncbi:hypothetical protein [Streptomyces sp. cmx-18-6]|uniref:hypothetical protein n=1 Tax=Streptomyces sp. cmx-18-6 TaxID=2790930 RepID=UPI00398139DA
MGISVAYPVFRTTDAAEAYAQAIRLCGLLEELGDEVALFAELTNVADLRRVAAVLPEGPFDYPDARTDPTTGDFAEFGLEVATADDASLEAELPLSLMVDVPAGAVGAAGAVEERFVGAIGRGIASVEWSGRWPDEPEFALYGSAAGYDRVSVTFNGDTAQAEQPADHHTVFVQVDKRGDLPRAERLAALIGGTVLGEAQQGW